MTNWNPLSMFYPIELEPVARKTPPFPGLKGVYAPNNKLVKTKLIPSSPGGESIDRDSSGQFYTLAWRDG